MNETIYCRKLQKADLSDVMEWRMQKDITRYLNTDPVLTMQTQLAWYERLCGHTPFYHWIVEVNGQGVGVIQIVDWAKDGSECEWGYYIAVKQARSLRLAVSLELSLYDFIFRSTSVDRITAQSFLKNASVIKIHELCGCNTVAVFKNHVSKNGETFDVVLQAMTRKTWEAQKERISYDPISFED